MIWLSLALVALAVARATLLITTDRIMLSFRRFLVNRYGEESLPTYLVHCARCTSIWLALPASIGWTLLTQPLHWWWVILPLWFALSCIATFLVAFLDRLEDRG